MGSTSEECFKESESTSRWDTGASTTLVSTALYHRIPEKERPEIGPARNMTAADGSPLEVLGRAKFDLELGTLQLRREFTIAGITDDILLGADVLQNHPDGPQQTCCCPNNVWFSMESRFHY